jgi:hypothetical protein
VAKRLKIFGVVSAEGGNVEILRFEDWWEAYDACRAVGQSIVAEVNGQTGMIFPDGSYLHVDGPEGEVIEDE